MNDLTTSYLAKKIDGKLFGPEKTVQGIFTFLNKAKIGDVVIRHWIDPVGVEMANDKGVSCIITQNPKDNTVEKAIELNIPIIITSKIEKANAFALKWSIENFAKNAVSVVVTGTNGKSTTTHMIHTILIRAGYNTYTNTDSKSEFNTLIDPVVSDQVYEFKNLNTEKIDAMVFEVSEVQGWMDKLMKDHAYLMTEAVDPDVLVLTNISMDHLGLVNSIEETFNEVYGSIRAVEESSKKNCAILNHDDPLLRKIGKMIGNKLDIMYHGTREEARRVTQAFLPMKKINIKALEAARLGK